VSKVATHLWRSGPSASGPVTGHRCYRAEEPPAQVPLTRRYDSGCRLRHWLVTSTFHPRNGQNNGGRPASLPRP
jgi:hypothetical protein